MPPRSGAAPTQPDLQTESQPPPPGDSSAATNNSPRVWLISSACSPLVVRLIRRLLAHGDYVAACLPPHELDDPQRSRDFRDLVADCKGSASASASTGTSTGGGGDGGGSGTPDDHRGDGEEDRTGWAARLRSIPSDARSMSQCGAAVAEALAAFGRVDIVLCCSSEAIIGTVEELAASEAARGLVQDQFETIFFSQVNLIKAVLPTLRGQHNGHIVLLTSIGGHIGTPEMSIHTAATWAIEGFCDSMAYEVAPFNVRVTIVQPHKEISMLTNRIVFAPALQPQQQDRTEAGGGGSGGGGGGNGDSHLSVPSVRSMLARGNSRIIYRYPQLPESSLDALVNETVTALVAIGGHENPPARHIVGFEGAEAVKEKLRNVTEELEDFIEATVSVDIFEEDGGGGAGQSGSCGNLYQLPR
ncbi:hypothetical protein Micbo1qcDRAFT_183019 [Microdochium bolleyi]|uniref:Short chain dehydrogenase/reductase family protein n=1 Tax=Microdochium bolleyi TaxID=196109 RepID=A0A136J6S5_9PEZI|nr:hypothetical protein Micbo1qcDRAFT_183019 [Microdochium bolleyi]